MRTSKQDLIWNGHGSHRMPGTTTPKRIRVARVQCSVSDCTRTRVCRLYCKLHYNRWLRHGDPLIVLPAYRLGPQPNENPEHKNRKVRFTPRLWKRWLRRKQERDPHAPVLREGINQMRGMLEKRT